MRFNTFNRLPEPWRVSPDSWHLSRYYYIYSPITLYIWRAPPDYLALKPGYYAIIVQYNTINVHPGNNRLPRSRHLRPGKDLLSALFRAPQVSPGEKAPTFRALPFRPKSTPPSVTGFREPPQNPAWLQGHTHTHTHTEGHSNSLAKCSTNKANIVRRSQF